MTSNAFCGCNIPHQQPRSFYCATCGLPIWKDEPRIIPPKEGMTNDQLLQNLGYNPKKDVDAMREALRTRIEQQTDKQPHRFSQWIEDLRKVEDTPTSLQDQMDSDPRITSFIDRATMEKHLGSQVEEVMALEAGNLKGVLNIYTDKGDFQVRITDEEYTLLSQYGLGETTHVRIQLGLVRK